MRKMLLEQFQHFLWSGSLSLSFGVFVLPRSLGVDKPSPSLLQEDGLSPREQELKDLKESLQDTQPVGVLVDCCRTMDQVRSPLTARVVIILMAEI